MAPTPPPPSRPQRRRRALPLLPALASLLLATLVPIPTHAVKYEPAVWNVHYNVSTRNVPNPLFMRTSSLAEDGKMTPAPIFPLGGFNVQSQCNSARQNGWLNSPERDRPGACEFYELDNGSFNYWQKVPGPALMRTNCYAYALNKLDAGSWGMPGASAPDAKAPDPSKFTCNVVGKGVEIDGGRKVTREEVFRSRDARPKDGKGGYYIALLVRPLNRCFFSSCTGDFHFLRRDDNGLWSEKMGATPVVNKDITGKPIEDPEKAEIGGGFTDFCGYYAVTPKDMKMGTMAVPDSFRSGMEKWKEEGLQVSAVPLPYKPGFDNIDPVALQQERLASQRGRRLMMEAAMGRRVGRWRHM
jgi:hypothetical protein